MAIPDSFSLSLYNIGCFSIARRIADATTAIVFPMTPPFGEFPPMLCSGNVLQQSINELPLRESGLQHLLL